MEVDRENSAGRNEACRNFGRSMTRRATSKFPRTYMKQRFLNDVAEGLMMVYACKVMNVAGWSASPKDEEVRGRDLRKSES